MLAKDKIKTTLESLLQTYPADELSVKLLCSEAGVSKQTIYNNYYGIMAVIKDIIVDYINEAVEGYQSNYYWMDGLRSILEMLRQKKHVIMHTYNSKYRYEMLEVISETVAPMLENGVTEEAERIGIKYEKTEEILIEMYMDIFMGVITRFISGGMTRNPGCLAKTYHLMMQQHTTNALLNLENNYRESY